MFSAVKKQHTFAMKTAHFCYENSILSPYKQAIPTVGMSNQQHGNGQLPAWECVVHTTGTASLRRAGKFLAPCRDVSCAVRIWYQLRGDIVSAPCRKVLRSMQSGQVDSGIVDIFRPYRSIVFREKNSGKWIKYPNSAVILTNSRFMDVCILCIRFI